MAPAAPPRPGPSVLNDYNHLETVFLPLQSEFIMKNTLSLQFVSLLIRCLGRPEPVGEAPVQPVHGGG